MKIAGAKAKQIEKVPKGRAMDLCCFTHRRKGARGQTVGQQDKGLTQSFSRHLLPVTHTCLNVNMLQVYLSM